jgi:hypothetical protein
MARQLTMRLANVAKTPRSGCGATRASPGTSSLAQQGLMPQRGRGFTFRTRARPANSSSGCHPDGKTRPCWTSIWRLPCTARWRSSRAQPSSMISQASLSRSFAKSSRAACKVRARMALPTAARGDGKPFGYGGDCCANPLDDDAPVFRRSVCSSNRILAAR